MNEYPKRNAEPEFHLNLNECLDLDIQRKNSELWTSTIAKYFLRWKLVLITFITHMNHNRNSTQVDFSLKIFPFRKLTIGRFIWIDLWMMVACFICSLFTPTSQRRANNSFLLFLLCSNKANKGSHYEYVCMRLSLLIFRPDKFPFDRE